MSDMKVKAWQTIAVALSAILVALSLYTYFKVSSQNHSIQVLEKKRDDLLGKVALSEANNESLRGSIATQSAKIDQLSIDLAAAEANYKIKEVYITKTIEKERLVVRDLNETEDYKHAWRVANEIIEAL